MDKEKKKQILVRITCFIAAFSLWFYINSAVNPIKETTIKGVTVKLINKETLTGAGLVELPDEKYTVDIKIKGPIPDIYQVNKDQIKVEVDMGKYALKEGANTIPVDIINNINNTSISILNSETVVVKVNLDKYMEKTFPIILTDLEVKTLSGYYNMPKISKPTEVVVSGPAKYVNMVNSLHATGVINESAKDIYSTVQLKAIDEAKREIKEVTVTPNTSEIVIPVKKVKSVKVNVVTTGNLPKGFKQDAVATSVDHLDIAADEKILNTISAIDTEPIDLSTVSNGKVIVAKLIIPEGVKNINNTSQTNVTFSLDEIVQQNFTLNIEYKNLGENLNVVMDKTTISIVVQGSKKVVKDTLKSTDFKATVDLTALIEGGPYSKNIDLTLPAGVTKVPPTPDTVSITLTKKVVGG